MFNEYSLNIPLRHPVGKSLTQSMQAFEFSPPLLFPPLIFLIFIVMSYKFNKIYNNNVNIWKIIIQQSIIHIWILCFNCHVTADELLCNDTQRFYILYRTDRELIHVESLKNIWSTNSCLSNSSTSSLQSFSHNYPANS